MRSCAHFAVTRRLVDDKHAPVDTGLEHLRSRKSSSSQWRRGGLTRTLGCRWWRVRLYLQEHSGFSGGVLVDSVVEVASIRPVAMVNTILAVQDAPDRGVAYGGVP